MLDHYKSLSFFTLFHSFNKVHCFLHRLLAVSHFRFKAHGVYMLDPVTGPYHMSRVGFYGEDQSEALKRHVVLSHTTCRSITRVRLTSDLPVPSAPEIFQSAMWYGIIPAWVVLCHTTWLENSKRERSMKGSFPPVVFRNQFEWR